MSRIQHILDKAERDGTARRTHGLPVEAAPMPPIATIADTATMEPDDIEPRAIEPPADVALATPITPQLHPLLVAGIAPESAAAEQYRSLRTRIAMSENGHPLRLLMITSPGKGDGKTLTVANLGLTMAQEFQRRVVIVDSDLRKPQVHSAFGIPQEPGLADVLCGTAELDDVLVYLSDYRLTILPAGRLPPQPAEFLGSLAMRRTLDALRARFDRVLLDMPPATPLADASILSPAVDAVLLIVRAGLTPKPAIERALTGIDNSKLLGLVLNEADGTDAERYGMEYTAK
jgi:capsular exopolysaccharide synthesis family protein